MAESEKAGKVCTEISPITTLSSWCPLGKHYDNGNDKNKSLDDHDGGQ